MQEEKFELRGEEYIELNKILKLKQIAQTGGHAKILIEDGEIKVNGEVEFRKRKKMRVGDYIEFENVKITIS
jgi:ribosome-associated protein